MHEEEEDNRLTEGRYVLTTFTSQRGKKPIVRYVTLTKPLRW